MAESMILERIKLTRGRLIALGVAGLVAALTSCSASNEPSTPEPTPMHVEFEPRDAEITEKVQCGDNLCMSGVYDTKKSVPDPYSAIEYQACWGRTLVNSTSNSKARGDRNYPAQFRWSAPECADGSMDRNDIFDKSVLVDNDPGVAMRVQCSKAICMLAIFDTTGRTGDPYSVINYLTCNDTTLKQYTSNSQGRGDKNHPANYYDNNIYCADNVLNKADFGQK